MESSNDIFEKTYWSLKQGSAQLTSVLRTIFIRLRKFLALPYCYFKFVDWKECKASRLRVVLDFLYIFFRLKTYPEQYGYCRFWELDRDDWKYYYGSNYDAYQSYRLGKVVQRKEYGVLYKDKEVCMHLCAEAGLLTPELYATVEPDEDYRTKLEQLCKQHDRLIIKPVRGHGGAGVQLIRNHNGSAVVDSGNEIRALDGLVLNERHLVQEFVEQDPRIAELTSSASIRVVTMYTRSGEVIILGCEVNMAATQSIVSNWSAGGVGVGIDTETGRLFEHAYDKMGRAHTVHPVSGIRFGDYVIPEWDSFKAFAIRMQQSLPYYRILGPDMTLSSKGPLLYEINATPDLAGLEQDVGPLLKNRKVLQAFREYDLLVNDAIRE